MAPNLKATLGAIPAGRLSVNAIFPTTPCSRTGLETASPGTQRTSAKKILALTSASNILGTCAWNADRDLYREWSQGIVWWGPQGCGERSARLAQLFGSLQSILSVICQVDCSCPTPPPTLGRKHWALSHYPARNTSTPVSIPTGTGKSSRFTSTFKGAKLRPAHSSLFALP